MKTKTINLYQFNELTEEQQAKVLDKYRDWNDDIFESYANDECNTLEIFENGFLNPSIYYSLGYLQGDGACFDCDDFDFDLLLKDWEHKHKSLLIKILQNRCYTKIKSNHYANFYSHSKTRYFEVDLDLPYNLPRLENALYSAEKHIENLRYKLAENLTNRLYGELEFLRSDDEIAGSLIANEYYFNGETLEIEY